MIELALPAGTLETALVAFKYGADAVYFGLKDFSARKGAGNFSEEDLSKIRRYSLENNKKIYVTFNTLLDDNSYDKALPLLEMLSFYGNDGVIIQDLGLASVIKKNFPSLHLHASTQMAVHTTEGVKYLSSIGFERVVLSRELSLKEIEKIRKDCPDVELKAFIHGALCYGFSGLCSASYNKCKRSANGGECAQICRSWFENSENNKQGYFFSMKDLNIGEEILKLNDIEIDSAKIEGRLKSPETIAAATRYYREILDGSGVKEDDKKALYTSFLRSDCDGYLNYKKNRESLVSPTYPGHIGLKAGVIVDQNNYSITIKEIERIENHDGLQFFIEKNGLKESIKFSASIINRDEDYLILRYTGERNLKGKEIYIISDSENREKTPNINIPLYRKEININVELNDYFITASSMGVKNSIDIVLEEAKNKSEFKEKLEKTFKESGESKYTLGKLSYLNKSNYDYPFVSPSLLKEFRRNFYSSLSNVTNHTKLEETSDTVSSITLPAREALSGDLPWSMDGKEIDGRTYFSFPPVTFHEEKTWREMTEKASGSKKPTIGINNVSQIKYSQEHPEFDYFVDIYLYLSSRFTASFLLNEIPNLVGGYLWFERKEKHGKWPFEPTVTSYIPPYFISRSCFRYDSLDKSCTGCTEIEDFHIKQNNESYIVKVRHCLTVVMKE